MAGNFKTLTSFQKFSFFLFFIKFLARSSSKNMQKKKLQTKFQKYHSPVLFLIILPNTSENLIKVH